ncbi:MAG: hypothetical protein GX434_16885 [Peptococcaceae bacterium]|nr:hypothetical protein [Peptococcaceae bacterium]
MPKPIILKLGGSLIYHNNGDILRRIGSIIATYASVHPLLIVAGGGPFADLVREYGRKFGLGEETCHFMALGAMDQYAYLLREFIPGSEMTYLLNTEPLIPAGLTPPGKPLILLVSKFFSQVPEAALPRSWDVTSDSIAAYLAKRIDCSMLVLVKSTDLDPSLWEPDVDPFFRQQLPMGMPVWFINGQDPERLAGLLQVGTGRGICIPSHAFSGQLFL